MFHHQRGRNWLLNRTKYQEFHLHYVVRSFHTGASLYLLRWCVWEYVPVSFLCLCCRWIGRCQCFVYFSTYQWNKKTLNETFHTFLKSSLFTLLSLAVYYVIYLLSGETAPGAIKDKDGLWICAQRQEWLVVFCVIHQDVRVCVRVVVSYVGSHSQQLDAIVAPHRAVYWASHSPQESNDIVKEGGSEEGGCGKLWKHSGWKLSQIPSSISSSVMDGPIVR